MNFPTAADLERKFGPLQREVEGLWQFSKPLGENLASTTFVTTRGLSPDEIVRWEAFQNGPVADFYYRNPGRSQWNIYLYLVVQETDVLDSRVRRRIETDQQFARKRILTPEELHALATTDPFGDAQGGPEPENLMGTWQEILLAAGLQGLLTDQPYRHILEQVEEGRGAPSSSPLRTAPPDGEPPLPDSLRISKVEIQKFRRLEGVQAATGSFHLIFGPNATGKTTFLEAIEALLAGSCRRTPGKLRATDIDVTMTLHDGTVHNTLLTTPQCRQLERTWFNSCSSLETELDRLFGLHNFFDVDAASRLDHEATPKEISAAILALVVGPELNEVQEKMSEVLALLEDRQREQARQLMATKARMEENRSAYQALSVRAEEDALETRKLADEYGRLTGSPAVSTLDALYAFVPVAGGLLEGEGGLSKMALIDAPVSRAIQVLGLVPRLRALQNEIDGADQRLSAMSKALEHLEVLERGVRLGWPRKWTERAELTEQVRRTKTRTDAVSLHLREIERHLPAAREWSLVPQRLDEEAAVLRHREKVLRRDLEGRFQGDVELMRAIQTLQDHVLVRRLSECPACGSHQAGAEALLRAFEAQLRSLEADGSSTFRDLGEVGSRLHLVEQFLGLSVHLGGARDLVVVPAELFAKGKEAEQALELQEELIRSLDQELLATGGLESRDFSAMVEQVEAALGEAGLRLDAPALEAARRALEGRAELEGEGLHRLVEEQAALQAGFPADLIGLEAVRQDLRQEDLAFLDRFARGPGTLRDVLAWTRAVRRHGLRAPAEAAVNQTTLQYLNEEYRSLLLSQAELAKRHEAVGRAKRALDTIQERHSLEAYAARRFEAHQELLSAIFRLVHRPYEIEAVRLKDGQVSLKDREGHDRTLREISSGQRAALALSTFLAVNLKTRKGPALMLLDDPIALVDDLNTVGFLDILQQLVLEDRRQIFFATANSVLAGLIHAKIPQEHLTTTLLPSP